MQIKAPLPGKSHQINSSVHRITAPNPGLMTGPGTNTYIIGEKKFLIIDPGPDIPEHIENILNFTNGDIDLILATHTHPDHSPAAKILKKATGASVIGRLPPNLPDQDLTFEPDYELEDGDTVTIEDKILQVVSTPGHASNHICLYDAEHRCLFSGDHIIEGSSVLINPPDGDMKSYLNSMEKIETFDINYIAPAHGGIIDNPHEAIKQTINHRLEREQKIRESLRLHPKIKLSDLVKYAYDDTGTEIHFLAERSLLAHLLKLKKENIVIMDENKWCLVL